jgi:hypothetical protein
MYSHFAPEGQALNTEFLGTCPELAVPAVEAPIAFPNRRERCSMSLFEFLALVVAPGNYVAVCYKAQDKPMGTRFFPRTSCANQRSSENKAT